MIFQIASYIGWFVLGMIALLLGVGFIIAFCTLIDYWRLCKQMKKGEECETSQDLKQTTKILEENNKQKTVEIKTNDAAFAKTIWAKLHDVMVITLWVFVYVIWFVFMCVVGFFGFMYDLVAACFKKKTVVH